MVTGEWSMVLIYQINN